MKKMRFDWREYLELAKKISNMSDLELSEEALYRSAVSRAYYAAFCWCRNFAYQRLGFKTSDTSKAHKELREFLKRKGGKWIRLASQLNNLRLWRNKCDYEDEVQGLSNMLKESIKFSENVINTCK